MRAKRSSAAISQSTGTTASGTPPSGAAGSGASRVQSTQESVVGKPEAIPSLNGSSLKRSEVSARDGRAENSGTTAPAARAATNLRRDVLRLTITRSVGDIAVLKPRRVTGMLRRHDCRGFPASARANGDVHRIFITP
jgi:hypothetical protein